MARRSPLLLLLWLPAFALGARLLLNSPTSASAGVAELAIPEFLAEAAKGAAEIALNAAEAPPMEANTATNRRVATRIEGRIAYTDGAVPGGPVWVVAGKPRANWQWQRAARRLHAGLGANALAHGVADADGRFALEWTGEQTELYVAALAPTAATETPLRWSAADGTPLTLTLEPRAALIVELRAGAGFSEGSAPNFHKAGLRLQSSLQTPKEPTEGVANTRFDTIAWVDEAGRATFLAAPVNQNLEVAYEGNLAVAAMKSVPLLVSGEQRSLPMQLDAGAHLLGRVVDEAGAPIESAHVRARGELGMGAVGTLVSARTNKQGRFDLRLLSPTVTSIAITKQGYVRGQHDVGPALLHGSRRDLGDLVLEQGASLAGRVLDSDGRPAAGVAVLAHMNPTSQLQTGTTAGWSSDANAATTDAEGRFQLRGLAKGVHYDLTARRDTDGGFQLAVQEDMPDGETNLVLVLVPAPGAIGKVLDPNGHPVAGAEVRAKREETSAWPWEDELFYTPARTDAEGNFRLQMEKPGTFSIRAAAKGFAPSLTVSIAVPGDVPLELQLRRSLTVNGRVVDTTGDPVQGATVSKADAYTDRWIAFGSDIDFESAEMRSDADGRFQMLAPAGQLVLRAQHPEYAQGTNVVVDVQEDQEAHEVVIPLARGATVRGVLYEGGERAGAGVSVTASASRNPFGTTVSTDAAGEFVFERLAAGRWHLFSMGSKRFPADPTKPNFAQAFENMRTQMLVVEDGGEYQVELGSPPLDPVHVRGRVLCAEKPLAKGVLTFLPLRSKTASTRIASVDETGRYDVVLPEPGSYVMTVRNGDLDANGNPGTSLELHCEIPAAPSHALDFHLPGGVVRGHVRGPDRKAVARVLVTCVREDGLAVGTMGGGAYGSTSTDAEGHYEITMLAPGSYRVAVGGERHPAWSDGSPTAIHGMHTGVYIGKDEVREGVDFELVAPGEVHGQITDGDGKPVADSTVFARYASGVPVESMGSTRSDAVGNFRWRGLPPGEYTFHARAGNQVSAESAPVTVESGEVAELDLVLAIGAYLIVRVESAESLELAQGLVRVQLRDAKDRVTGETFSREDWGDRLSTERSFDEQRFGPLAPGSYRASATGPDGNRVERRVELSPGQERRLRLRLKD
ncbi:MAG: hypothetical protein GC161_10080 [Planctomycetaceae bacterium]|nr:hypothetical protein [Planctomycetaceae bacterium]